MFQNIEFFTVQVVSSGAGGAKHLVAITTLLVKV
jgi:hypothetical protein